ncbi:helix-turn-helix domain-containing protein [Streptomyces sp. NPDC101175]|uniref:helix-turn-helix domain-containing protein n=1 Tax=Streptomyces sp. NPDC101175 TaxID=3366123 RepID=UPI003833B7F5
MDLPAQTSGEVIDQGIEDLQGLLGEAWEVSIEPQPPLPLHGDEGWDAVVRVLSRGDGMFTELLVDVRDHLTPKGVTQLSSTAALVRRLNRNSALMVFSPWISPKTQEELRRREIDFLDLTGNISLRISRPAVVIHTQGAVRAPASHRSSSSGKPLLTGPRAGRLIRLLADVKPPYRATELAEHSDLSLPYVSRLLDALEDQLLIGREGRTVTSVHWQDLLRTRASHLDLMRQTNPQGLLAPNGVQQVLDQLVNRRGFIAGGEVLVTGSYAARPIAPVAVGGQLMLYVMPDKKHTRDVVQELHLLPVPEAADVLLLRAPDLGVLQRPRRYDRFFQVGLSQLVLDCLSGPGRMPAEGEKVLAFMEEERLWRTDSLSLLSRDESHRLF